MSVYFKHDHSKVVPGNRVAHRAGGYVEVIDAERPCSFRLGANIRGKWVREDGQPDSIGVFSLFYLDGVFHSTDTQEFFNGEPRVS